MKELVEYLVKSLVDRPEEVLLAQREREKEVIMELKVAAEDLGKVIGKKGSTINAIRAVLQAFASTQNKRIRLEVLG